MDDSSPDQHQDYRITIAREREEGIPFDMAIQLIL